jgi:hypothetical protein
MYLATYNAKPQFIPPMRRRRRRLGQIQQIASAAPGIAGQAALSTGLIAGGTALSVAVPIVGAALAAVIGSLFAAHAARVKGATTENAVLNSLIPTVQQAISAVSSSVTSGQTSPTDAISALQSIQEQYWQAVAQVETGPGQAGGPGKCVAQTPNPNAGTTCDKSCTASCCIGCNVINEWIYKATCELNGTPNTLPWNPIVGNKYGLTSSASPSWSFAPGSSGSLSSALSSVTNASVLGIPLWVLAAGGLGLFFLL